MLSAYNYTIKYKSGKQLGNIILILWSRFPLLDSAASVRVHRRLQEKMKKYGATTFLVELPDGQIIHHGDLLKHNSLDPQIPLQQYGGYCQMLTWTHLN